MGGPLFTLYGDSKLTKTLQAEVNLGLKQSLTEKDLLEKTLNKRTKALGRLSFFRLHILNREFTGRELPAIRLLVTSARSAVQKVQQLKIRIKK